MSVSRTASGRWRAVVKSGRQYVTSRTFDVKRDALAWEQRQRALLDGVADPRAGRTRVRAALAEWLDHRSGRRAESTVARDRSVVAALPASLLGREVGSLRPTDMERVLAGVPGATASAERAAITLRAWCSWLVREGMVPVSPMQGVRVSRSVGAPPREMSPWTWPGLESTVAGMREYSPRLAEVVLVLGHVGLRWGEARAMRVEDVLPGVMPTLRVRRSHSEGYSEKTTKGRARRTVPIPARVWPIVQGWTVDRDPGEYLMVTGTGAMLHKSNVRRALCWTATAPGRSIQDLRHTAATEWLRAGVDVRTVQAWLGHEDLSTTQGYVHYLGTAADRAAYDLVNRAGGTPGAHVTDLDDTLGGGDAL